MTYADQKWATTQRLIEQRRGDTQANVEKHLIKQKVNMSSYYMKFELLILLLYLFSIHTLYSLCKDPLIS